MIIDIIIVALVLLATIIGMRQGFITQLCYFAAIILSSLIAPSIATPLGSMFTENVTFAFIIGFGITLLIAIILVWLIAPLLKKLIRWEKLRKINTILGAIVGFSTMTIFVALSCSTINTLNFGDLRTEKVVELGKNYTDEHTMQKDLEKLANKDASMRDYYEPRFIAYETLDDSMLFGYMSTFGDVVCPGLSSLRENITENLKQQASETITNTLIESND